MGPDSVRLNQVLVIYEAKRRHLVRIADEDVMAWPMRPEVAGKYYPELVNLVERVRRRQFREHHVEGGQGNSLLGAFGPAMTMTADFVP